MREGKIKPRHQDLQWFSYEAPLRLIPLLEYPTRDFTMSTSSLYAEKTVYTSLTKKEKSLDYNNSFLGEYECSTLALDREEKRDEKEEIGSLKTRSNNFEHEHVVMNPTSAGMRLQHRHLYLYLNVNDKQQIWTNIALSFVEVQFRRTSLTGFPAQSVRSSNVDALDSPYLLVLNTGTSQSRQHNMSESDSYYLSD
ncbi:hypothetical protein Tco_1226023 [Tanacetum coccineum]